MFPSIARKLCLHDIEDIQRQKDGLWQVFLNDDGICMESTMLSVVSAIFDQKIERGCLKLKESQENFMTICLGQWRWTRL